MSRIGYTLKHSGLSTTFRKVFRTMGRYGLSPNKMCKNIQMYSKILSKHGVVGNIFIPAKSVEDNIELFQNNSFDNIHFGAHGYMHIDYTTLSLDEQRKHFERALNVFSSLGIKNVGFRAPYGRLNEESVNLLASLGFAFDSSQVFVYNSAVSKIKLLKNLLNDYSVVNKNLPYCSENILRIPFTLPDDEILVDRLNCNVEEIKEIWFKMIENIEKFGNLFVLQLHANRIQKLSYVLECLIDKSITSGVEIIDLFTLSKEYIKNNYSLNKKYLCITGDVDAISLKEFMR